MVVKWKILTKIDNKFKNKGVYSKKIYICSFKPLNYIY
jgi:hypothetical protein